MSSWSMKAVLLGIRAKFSHVNHLSCDQVEEMRSSVGNEPQLIVIFFVLMSASSCLL